MVSILLTLLKILGILLLALLALALLLLLGILLAPFRYELRGTAEDLHSVRARGRVSWLGRLLWGQIQWEDGEWKGVLRLAGIPLRRFPGSGSKKREADGGESLSGRPEPSGKEEPAAGPEPSGKGAPSAGSEPPGREASSDRPASTGLRKPEIRAAGWEQPEGEAGKAKSGFSHLRDRGEQILDFLQEPENQKLFAFLREQLAALWRHVRPRTVDVWLRVGLPDPADTGAVLAAAYMFYPLYEGHIRVEGEFEGNVREGKALLRGRIRILTLLIIGLRVYRNPAVQAWRKRK